MGGELTEYKKTSTNQIKDYFSGKYKTLIEIIVLLMKCYIWAVQQKH